MAGYRVTLEVLKWAGPKDVLRHYTEVCAVWSAASKSSELWESFLDDSRLPNRPFNYLPCSWYRKALGELRIPLFSESQCDLYTIPNLNQSSIKLKSPVSPNSAYVFLSVNRLMCCGGSYSKKVFEVNVDSGTVFKKRHLVEPRNWAGIVRIGSTVYVIAGSNYSGQLTTGEKLGMDSDGPWVLLQGRLTHPRNGFTPFLLKGKIYCIGRCPEIEVMDLETEQFTVITGVTLPKRDFWTLSFACGDGFIVVQSEWIGRYEVEKGVRLVQENSGKYFRGYWSNCPPVRYGDCWYSVLNPNPAEGILRVDAAALTYEKVL